MLKIVTSVLLMIACLALGLAVFPTRKIDFLLFQELLKSSSPETDSPFLSYSEQKREGVSKHIWYQENNPLYIRIVSQESELFFFSQNNQMEVIEQLGNVVCLMQEDLYFEKEKPMQRVRYLEAESASYNYNTHLFVAEEAELWTFQLPGHELPKTVMGNTPILHATAQSVEFSLKGDQLNFLAHRMKARMEGKEPKAL
jgi:hypothetical protein